MTPDAGPSPRVRPNLVVRSVLTSVAFILISIPTMVVAGAYVPQAQTIAGFGRLLMTDLPWLALGAGMSLAMTILATRLGGRKFTRLLAAVCLIVLVAIDFVGVQWAFLAGDHGTSYDVFRQARSVTPVGRGPDRDIAFAEVEGRQLHAQLWYPAAVSTGAIGAADSRAGVMFLHGGGFVEGWLGARPNLFASLAASGYVVVDVEYRLAPPPRWQDAPNDVLCALGWLQHEAGSLGIDPKRIVVMGDSAGGNLALIAAYGPGYQGLNGLAPSCNFTPVPPAGVIAVHPTADLAGTWADLIDQFGGEPFPAVYTGGTPADVPERYEAASVQRLIRTGLPPTLLYTGVTDLLVHVDRIRSLAKDLRAAGVAVELVEVPFADHGFDSPPNGFGAQLEEALLPTFIDGLASTP